MLDGISSLDYMLGPSQVKGHATEVTLKISTKLFNLIKANRNCLPFLGCGVRCVWYKTTEERREDRRLIQQEKVKLREERDQINPRPVRTPAVLTPEQVTHQRLIKKQKKEAARAYKKGFQSEMLKLRLDAEAGVTDKI